MPLLFLLLLIFLHQTIIVASTVLPVLSLLPLNLFPPAVASDYILSYWPSLLLVMIQELLLIKNLSQKLKLMEIANLIT
jgi:hypothetical protein